MMSRTRLFALIVVACALAALMAIPVEHYEALGFGSTPSSAPAQDEMLPPPPPRSTTADSSEHTEPRLWLR
jgi:hypothetical protein